MMNPIHARAAVRPQGVCGEDAAPLAAAAPFQRGGDKPNWVMFMPGGSHTITPGYGDAACEVTINVTPETAAVLNASLQSLNERFAPQRALFDKNHEGKEAMAWPKSFHWSDSPEPGVYASVEYSSLGEEFIAGKVMRAFSGCFYTDAALPKRKEVKAGKMYTIAAGKRGSAENPALVTGLDFPYAGTFTNDPAFLKILPLWARNAGASGAGSHSAQTDKNPPAKKPTSPITNMEKNKAALQARLNAVEQEIESLMAEGNTAEGAEALKAKRVERDGLKQELAVIAQDEKNQELETALLAQRKSAAEAAVKAAVARGALPAKNTELQEKWTKWCTETPEMLEALAAQKGITNSPHQPIRITATGAHVTRASNLDMLNGLNAIHARNRGESSHEKKRLAAREFAALYAREVMSRLREGDDIALSADNSLGTLVSTLVSTRTLELLTLTFPLLKRLATDFSDQVVKYGDTLTTHIVGIPSVTTYHQQNGWSKSDANMVAVNITYDKKKGVDIAIDDQSLNSTVRRLFEEIAPAQAYALAKDIVDFVYTLITAAFTGVPANKSATGVAIPVIASGLGGFGRSTLIDAGGALDDLGNPDMGRFAILNRAYYSNIAKDEAVITLAAFQRAKMIDEGLGHEIDIEGMKVSKAVNLPNTVLAGGIGTLKGFAGSKSSLCVASRLSADYMNILPGAGNGLLTVVTTPGGFSANQVQYVDNKLATANQRMEIIYGANRGQVEAGILIAEP